MGGTGLFIKYWEVVFNLQDTPFRAMARIHLALEPINYVNDMLAPHQAPLLLIP